MILVAQDFDEDTLKVLALKYHSSRPPCQSVSILQNHRFDISVFLRETPHCQWEKNLCLTNIDFEVLF